MLMMFLMLQKCSVGVFSMFKRPDFPAVFVFVASFVFVAMA
jgi:hypothetical protein